MALEPTDPCGPNGCPADSIPTNIPIELRQDSSSSTDNTLKGMFNELYDIVVEKAKIELDNGRIVESQYATIVATSLLELIKQSITYQLASDKTKIDNTIKQEQWLIQKEMMEAQRDNAIVDRNKKFAMVEKDYDIKVAQEAQILADVDFTVSKQQIMEWTRLDNIRIKAASEFGDFLKYLSAADVVASAADFASLRKLVENIQVAVDSGQEEINMDELYYPGMVIPASIGGDGTEQFGDKDTQPKA